MIFKRIVPEDVIY